MSTPGAFDPAVTAAIEKSRHMSANAVLSSPTYDGMLMPHGLAANIVTSLSRATYVPDDSSDIDASKRSVSTRGSFPTKPVTPNPFLADMLPTSYLASLQSPVHQSFEQHAAHVKPSYFGDSRSMFVKIPSTAQNTHTEDSPHISIGDHATRSAPTSSLSAGSSRRNPSLATPRLVAADSAASSPVASAPTRAASVATLVADMPAPLPVPSPAELPSLLLPPLVTTNPYLYLASTFTSPTISVAAPHRRGTSRKKTARAAATITHSSSTTTPATASGGPEGASEDAATSTVTQSTAARASTLPANYASVPGIHQSLRKNSLTLKKPLPPTYISEVSPEELLPASAKHPLPLPLPPILSSCRPPKHFDAESRTLLTVVSSGNEEEFRNRWSGNSGDTKKTSNVFMFGKLSLSSPETQLKVEQLLPSDDSLTGGFSKDLAPVTILPPVAVLDDSYSVTNKVKKSRQLERAITSGAVALRDLDERWLVPWGVHTDCGGGDDIRTRADKAQAREEGRRLREERMRAFSEANSRRSKQASASGASTAETRVTRRVRGRTSDSVGEGVGSRGVTGKDGGSSPEDAVVSARTAAAGAATASADAEDRASHHVEGYADENDDDDDDSYNEDDDDSDDSDDMSASDDDNMTEQRADARVHLAIAHATRKQFQMREPAQDKHKPVEKHSFSSTFGAAPARPAPPPPSGVSLVTAAGTVQPLQSHLDATREWVRPLPEREKEKRRWLPPPPLPPLPPSIFPALPPPVTTNSPFPSTTTAVTTASRTPSCLTLPSSRCLVDYTASLPLAAHGPGSWDPVHYSQRGFLKREVLSETERRRGPGSYEVAKATGAIQPHEMNPWTGTSSGNGFRAMAHNFDSTLHHYSNPEMNANNRVVLVNVKVDDSGQLVQRGGGGDADMGSARTIAVVKHTTPGPGTYRSHTAIDPRVWSCGSGAASAAFTIGHKHVEKPVEVTPGPGHYAQNTQVQELRVACNRQIATLLVPSYRKHQPSVAWLQRRREGRERSKSKTRGKKMGTGKGDAGKLGDKAKKGGKSRKRKVKGGKSDGIVEGATDSTAVDARTDNSTFTSPSASAFFMDVESPASTAMGLSVGVDVAVSVDTHTPYLASETPIAAAAAVEVGVAAGVAARGEPSSHVASLALINTTCLAGDVGSGATRTRGVAGSGNAASTSLSADTGTAAGMGAVSSPVVLDSGDITAASVFADPYHSGVVTVGDREGSGEGCGAVGSHASSSLPASTGAGGGVGDGDSDVNVDSEDDDVSGAAGTHVVMRVREAHEDSVRVLLGDDARLRDYGDADSVHEQFAGDNNRASTSAMAADASPMIIVTPAAVTVAGDIGAAAQPSPAPQESNNSNSCTVTAATTDVADAAAGAVAATNVSAGAAVDSLASETPIMRLASPGPASRKKSGGHAHGVLSRLTDDEVFPWIVAGAQAALEKQQQREQAKSRREKARARAGQEEEASLGAGSRERSKSGGQSASGSGARTPTAALPRDSTSGDAMPAMAGPADDGGVLSLGLSFSHFSSSTNTALLPISATNGSFGAPSAVASTPAAAGAEEPEEDLDMLYLGEGAEEEESDEDDEVWDYAEWGSSPFGSATHSQRPSATSSRTSSRMSSRAASRRGSRPPTAASTHGNAHVSVSSAAQTAHPRGISRSQSRMQLALPSVNSSARIGSSSFASRDALRIPSRAPSRVQQPLDSTRAFATSKLRSPTTSSSNLARQSATTATAGTASMAPALARRRTTTASVAPALPASSAPTASTSTLHHGKTHSSSTSSSGASPTRQPRAPSTSMDCNIPATAGIASASGRGTSQALGNSFSESAIFHGHLQSADADSLPSARVTPAMQQQSDKYAAAMQALPRLRVSAHSDTSALAKALADKGSSLAMHADLLLLPAAGAGDSVNGGGSKAEPVNLFSTVQSRVGKTGLKTNVGTHHDNLGKARKQAAIELLGPSIVESGSNVYVLEKYEDMEEKRLAEQRLREERRKTQRAATQTCSLNVGPSAIPVDVQGLRMLGVSVNI